MSFFIINEKYLINQNSDLIVCANQIKNDISVNDIIVLDVCYKYSDKERIKLLKSIRLLEINNHVLFYSWHNLLNQLKDDSLFLILLSKGITYKELPCNLYVDNETILEKAEKQNLLPFFRSELDLVSIRHDIANKWGIERIKKVLNKTEISLNYNYELLKYLNPSKENSKENSSLNFTTYNKYKNKFSKNNPTIIYYDDCANEWGPILKEIFGQNFHFFEPKTLSLPELEKKINKLKPTSILLDLRLENESNFTIKPNELSGAIVLAKLKKQFYTLPIIMFTATNKAESVRELIKIGADYVWTKEGIDNGINDDYTLQNIVLLMKMIDDNHFKFKSDIQRKIFEIEYKINNFKYDVNYEKVVTTLKKLSDTIVFDTNFFLDKKNILELLELYLLLKANHNLKFKDSSTFLRFIIHNDVFREIFTLTQTSTDKEVVELSKFIMRFIYKLKNENLIIDDLTHGQVLNINELTENEVSNFSQIEIERQTFFKKIINIYDNKLESKLSKLKDEVANKNATIQELNKLIKRITLHADETFRIWIPELVAKEKILFISNDNRCAYNVGEELRTKFHNEIKEEKIYYLKRENSEIIDEVKGVNKLQNNKYTHLKIEEFYKNIKVNK